MKPVSDLAKRLSQLGEETPSPGLARWFPDDEVGQLAAALDSYAERVHQLVERDREFNADVSHELRTPLAVISGAAEQLAKEYGTVLMEGVGGLFVPLNDNSLVIDLCSEKNWPVIISRK